MTEKDIILTNEGLDIFLAKNSFSGLLSLYTFWLAYTSRKGFSFETIEKKIDFLPTQYCLAFLVVSRSLGFIEHTVNKNIDENIYNITFYNPLLAMKIKDAVYHKANLTDSSQNNTAGLDPKLLWKTRIEQIEQYFY